MDARQFSWRILQLVKVIDGDTVDLMLDRGFYDMSVIRFRLVNINTPELNSKDVLEREAKARKAAAKAEKAKAAQKASA
jgi:endonuclease YncB( thermonuclease family)